MCFNPDCYISKSNCKMVPRTSFIFRNLKCCMGYKGYNFTTLIWPHLDMEKRLGRVNVYSLKYKSYVVFNRSLKQWGNWLSKAFAYFSLWAGGLVCQTQIIVMRNEENSPLNHLGYPLSRTSYSSFDLVKVLTKLGWDFTAWLLLY